MEWAIVPSSIAAAGVIITIAWKAYDTIRARPRVLVEAAGIELFARTSEECRIWGLTITVRNLSSVPDRLYEVTVAPEGGALIPVSVVVPPPPLEPFVPVTIATEVNGPPVPQGTVLKGQIVLKFARARIKYCPFATSCVH